MATVRINPGVTEYTVPAKLMGFDVISITADLTDFTDTRAVIEFEAFSQDAKGVLQRIAYMATTGGVRSSVNPITGAQVLDPNLLTFTTGANREYRGSVTVRLTVSGAAARISVPVIVTV